MTPDEVQPILPCSKPRLAPEEVQAASYLAASAKTESLSRSSIPLSACTDAARLAARLVEIGDDLHQIRCDGSDAEQHKDRRGSSHVHTLRIVLKLLF